MLVVVGNKADLRDGTSVDSKMAADFAASVGGLFYEASAKDNRGACLGPL